MSTPEGGPAGLVVRNAEVGKQARPDYYPGDRMRFFVPDYGVFLAPGRQYVAGSVTG
jgi:hypothetical protein